MERNKDDGKTYLVQYFERQRFEYHPENKGTRYEVLLGRLGAEQVNTTTLPKSTQVSRIAFAGESDSEYVSEIYSMDPDGSHLLQLTNNRGVELSPSWSPDGRRIAYLSRQQNEFHAYLMKADGSGQSRLTNSSTPEWGARWSPDGQKIAISSPVGSGTEIFLVKADGSQRTQLTYMGNDNYVDDWSPDGQRLVFQCDWKGSKNQAAQICIINADGTHLVHVTDDKSDNGSPSWSPDGRRIAFTSNRERHYGIYVMNIDGSNQQRLTNSPDFDEGDPVWSPDGSRIAYVSDPGDSSKAGPNNIYAMNADGTNKVLIMGGSLSKSGLSWSRPAK